MRTRQLGRAYADEIIDGLGVRALALAAGGEDVARILFDTRDPTNPRSYIATTKSGKILAHIGSFHPITNAGVLQDGRVVTGDTHGQIKIWQTGKPATHLPGPTGSTITCLTIIAGKKIAVGDARGTVRLWWEELPVTTFSAHAGSVQAICSMPGAGLATGGADGFIRIWDADNRLLRTIPLHSGILALSSAPEGIVAYFSDGFAVIGLPDY